MPVKWGPRVAALTLTLLLVVFLIVPIGKALAVGLNAESLRLTLTDATVLRDLRNSLALAAWAALLSMLIAVPMAVLRGRCSFRGQAFLGMAVLVPLILPPFVGALSMERLLSQFGVLNLILCKVGVLAASDQRAWPDWLEGGFWATAALQSLHLFPILYLNALASLASIDPAYSQAARNLGAGPLRTFFRVTLPLMRPGLFAGGTIVFIWSFTDIGTPAIMNYTQVIAVRLFLGLLGDAVLPSTFSAVFIMLSMSVGLYIVGKYIFGRGAEGESTKASVAAESRRLGAAGTLGAWLLFGVVLAAALVPHVGVVLHAVADKWMDTILPTKYSLSNFARVIQDADTYQSIVNSVRYAGLSTAVDLVLGTLAAWLIVRSRVRGANLLDGLTMLPLAVPGLILAAGYVALTAPGTPLESLGPKYDPMAIIVIAYSVRRLPFVVRSVGAGLQQVPVSLEESARNLGASRLGAALRITLPLVLANMIAAGVLTFAFAMLEVSDSLILAQTSDAYPITKKIYLLATSGNTDAVGMASALGVYGMVLLGGTMALASVLMGKKLGAAFRA